MAQQTLCCLGTGGVGKTTLAAALGLAAARKGHRILLLTIDPARRLAQALGLGVAQQSQHTISDNQLASVGVTTGTITVELLDVAQTFQDLLVQLSPNEQIASSIGQHPLYHAFVGAISGSHEYAAITKLFDALANPNYDVVVLDTPPAQNALLFLDAPAKILRFIQQNTIQWLLRQAGLASRWSNPLLDISGKLFIKLFDKLAGAATLKDLVALLGLVQELTPALEERAKVVQQQLQLQAIDLWLIAGAKQEQQDNAEDFVNALQARGMLLKGCIVNRLHPPPPKDQDIQLALQQVDRLTLPQGAQIQAIINQWVDAYALEQHVLQRWHREWGIPVLGSHRLLESTQGLHHIAQIADHLPMDRIIQPKSAQTF